MEKLNQVTSEIREKFKLEIKTIDTDFSIRKKL